MKASQFPGPYSTPGVIVQYKGIWDMQDLYEAMADFLKEKKFKIYEKMHRHRSPSPFGVERNYNFDAEADIEHYYRWVLNINIETFDEHEVEVVDKNGKKKRMTKGRLWLRISGHVETDYEKVFERSNFYAHLRNFYNKYIIHQKIGSVWWDQLYYHVVLPLHEVVTTRLDMMSQSYEHRHFSGVR